MTIANEMELELEKVDGISLPSKLIGTAAVVKTTESIKPLTNNNHEQLDRPKREAAKKAAIICKQLDFEDKSSEELCAFTSTDDRMMNEMEIDYSPSDLSILEETNELEDLFDLESKQQVGSAEKSRKRSNEMKPRKPKKEQSRKV